MGSAKDILLKPISAAEANALIRRLHYSGKIVRNSQMHIGVFYQGKLEGAMQFGPPLDKRKMQGLVSGTLWHEFIELNRVAFSDKLPRNSESRALAIAFRLLRKYAPHIKWVISFADATQCGDGTIYRAAGFVLTGIKQNDQIWIAPDERGSRESRTSLTGHTSTAQKQRAKTISRTPTTKGKHIIHSMSLRPASGIKNAARTGGGSTMKAYIAAGFRPLDGFQLRYIYFLDPACRDKLTVPIIPFSRIDEMGAGMYKGRRRKCADEVSTSDTPDVQSGEGGAIPTRPLDGELLASDKSISQT